MEIKVLNRIDT